jgi:hypothetical protein
VSFRLVEAEYHQLRTLCEAQGVRSLSDFARDAVRRCMAQVSATGEGPESVECQLNRLDVHLKLLEHEMGRLLNTEAK